MTNKKSTKRALLLSVLSLVMCVSMLIGSTFAWFTDSVTSEGNIIKSGKLDVGMYWADGTKAIPAADSADWKDASEGAMFTEDQLWEPGYTDVKHIKISNEGNLALKYQLNIIANGTVSELADVIDVYYADSAQQVADRTALKAEMKIGTLTEVLAKLSTTASGELLADEEVIITLALKMKETAGNKYQEMSIGSDFTVQLMATQLTSETDSFDNQYDKMATVDDIDELKAALAEKSVEIVLGSNIVLNDGIVIAADQNVAIDLAGYTMSQAYAQTTAYAMINNKGNLTIKDSVGTGKISYADIGTGGEYASNTIRNEGTLNVMGGTIENISSDEMMSVGYPHAIDVYQGSTTNISGGTVKSANYDSIRMFCNSETLATTVNITGGTIINRVSFQDPAASRAGYGVLKISGGTFVTTDGVSANVRLLNFSNVSSNMKAEVTGGTFDKGFKTQDIVNKGVKTSDWLNIGECIAVANKTELQAALDNATNGTIIKFVANIADDVMATQKADIAITVDGNGYEFNGVFTINGKSSTANNTAAITIKNVNFNAEGISKDACIRLGGDNSMRYIKNVTVDNCTFTGILADEKVGVKSYTGGDKNIIITSCTATGMHSLTQLYVTEGVTITGCTVTDSKNGISVRSSNNVVISGCVIDVNAYGIRADGGACTQSIKNNSITATQPIIVRKLTSAGYELNLEGNTLTATSADGYQVILTTGSDDVAYVAPVAGNYTVNGQSELNFFK